MTLDNMTGITEGSYTGFCKSQLITCNRVKECNGVCPFEDALKHADKMQTMNDQHTVDHDRDWIIGCIEHDGFIHTHRFDKANQIIHDALSAEAEWIPITISEPNTSDHILVTYWWGDDDYEVSELDYWITKYEAENGNARCKRLIDHVIAWRPMLKPYREDGE